MIIIRYGRLGEIKRYVWYFKIPEEFVYLILLDSIIIIIIILIIIASFYRSRNNWWLSLKFDWHHVSSVLRTLLSILADFNIMTS